MLAKLSDFLASIDRFLNSLMEGTVIVSGLIFVISRRSVDLIRMQIFNSCFDCLLSLQCTMKRDYFSGETKLLF